LGRSSSVGFATLWFLSMKDAPTDHAQLIQESDVGDEEVVLTRTNSPMRRVTAAAVAGSLLLAGVVASAAWMPGTSPTRLEQSGDGAELISAVLAAKEGKVDEKAAKPKATKSVKTEHKAASKKPQTKHEKKEEKEQCGFAVKGDDCYNSVVWAMTDGIKKHPEWYEGLTQKSRFEEFQAHLALEPKDTKCTQKPCKAAKDCKTAAGDSPCAAGVKWDITDGISKHPEWYPGLTNKSSFEDFQRHAHKNNKTQCPTEPCNVQPFKYQTLFCWMAVQADGYELGLASAQLEKKVGIWACDDQVLISTKDLGLDSVTTLTISNMQVGGYTDGGTSPNAPIFVEAWQKVAEDGRWNDHDWTIKSDPDAVLLPDRLRQHLLPDQQPENPYPPPYDTPKSKGQFVTNCDKMAGWGKGWGDGWPMMYGSLEIISHDALALYYEEHEGTCQGPGGLGEDAYMGLCLRALGVGELFMRQGDNVCAGGACDDKSFSSYHPYKDVGSWFSCYDQATR